MEGETVLDDPDARVNGVGVIETPFVFLNLFECRIDPEAPAIRAMHGHQFNHVRDGRDARLEQDVVAAQALRVA